MLPLTKFNKYKATFHNKVSTSPKVATFVVTTLTGSDADSLKSFMGSSGTRQSSTKVFNVLFNKQALSYERGKPGIDSQFTGVVYVSPDQLVNAYGTYKVNGYVTRIIIDTEEFIVDNINYLEELYGSCIAVEINLKDLIDG